MNIIYKTGSVDFVIEFESIEGCKVDDKKEDKNREDSKNVDEQKHKRKKTVNTVTIKVNLVLVIVTW